MAMKMIYKWGEYNKCYMMSEKKEDQVFSLRSGSVMPGPPILQASSKNCPVFSGSVNFRAVPLNCKPFVPSTVRDSSLHCPLKA